MASRKWNIFLFEIQNNYSPDSEVIQDSKLIARNQGNPTVLSFVLSLSYKIH